MPFDQLLNGAGFRAPSAGSTCLRPLPVPRLHLFPPHLHASLVGSCHREILARLSTSTTLAEDHTLLWARSSRRGPGLRKSATAASCNHQPSSAPVVQTRPDITYTLCSLPTRLRPRNAFPCPQIGLHFVLFRNRWGSFPPIGRYSFLCSQIEFPYFSPSPLRPPSRTLTRPTHPNRH
jgi:hypothetical protein